MGGRAYVESVKEVLGLKVRKRSIVGMGEGFAIQEDGTDYDVHFEEKNSYISAEISSAQGDN